MELAHQEAVKTLKMVCCPCMDVFVCSLHSSVCVCVGARSIDN